MKKYWMKSMAALLAGIVGCSAVLAACKDDETLDHSQESTSVDTGVETEGEYTFTSILEADGYHIRLQSETDKYVLKDGVTEYKILAPENMQSNELLAVDELKALFEEATGVELPLVQNDELAYSESVKYIALGNTSFAEALGVAPTYAQVGQQGYVIQTRGNSIIVRGQGHWGTLYGVYDLLGEWFGFDFFAPDVYALDKNVKDLKLANYNIKEKPDIGAYQPNYGDLYSSHGAANVSARYRMTSRQETILMMNGSSSVHSMQAILPQTEHGEAHPLWYTDWLAQGEELPSGEENLCLTAHGDAGEYAALVTAMRDEIIQEFKGGSTGNIMILGEMDGTKSCECTSCKANTDKYGQTSANGILFIADLLDAVYEWFETDDGKPYERDFYVAILAYLTWEYGPFTYDAETDSYIVNEGLKVHEKMGVMLAPIKYDFGGLSTETKNQPIFQNMEAWVSVSAISTFYLYDFNNKVQFAPWDTLASKEELYQFMADANALYLYDQGEWLQTGLPTGFALPKIYVMTKLRWNTKLNVNELLDAYFEGVYGEVEDTVGGVYWSFRNHWANMRELSKVTGSGIEYQWLNYLSGRIHRAALWPFNLMQGWLNSYNQALEDIEYLKNTNLKKYQQLELYIRAERVSVLYLLVTLYPTSFSDTELLKLRIMLRDDVELSGISLLQESGDYISDLFNEWGIA